MAKSGGDLLVPVPPRTVAVVGLPRPDEKSLAGTSCTSATRNIGATAHSPLNEMHVFRLSVRELSGLGFGHGMPGAFVSLGHRLAGDGDGPVACVSRLPRRQRDRRLPRHQGRRSLSLA